MTTKNQPNSIESQRKVLHAKLISKYNWELIEPYLDVQLSLSSRKRERNFITLRQFKELVESGVSMREMHKHTSKNLALFYSNFCQGKITLTKEAFLAEYLKGKSLEQIAKENNISYTYIGFLRQIYEVKAKGPKFINRKATEIPMTQRQKEIAYGSMMGDAGRMSPSSIKFKQSIKQKDYLMWKFEEMKSISSAYSLQQEEVFDKRNENTTYTWRFYTNANSDIEEINNEFYKDGNKEVSQKILDNLTSLSIAVWCMDDGKTDMRHRFKNGDLDTKHTNVFSFCTDSFSLNSCELIVNYFDNKYNIKSRIRQRGVTKQGDPRYRVIIENESVDDFVRLISPHIHESMKYKIDYKAYLEWRNTK